MQELVISNQEVLTRAARGTEPVAPEPVAVPEQLALDMDDFDVESGDIDPPDEAIAG